MPQYAAPPEGGLRRLIWKYKLRFDATFGLTMLSWQEITLIWVFVLAGTLLFWLSVFTYLPSHVTYLRRRFAYYVFDDETVSLGPALIHWARSFLQGSPTRVVGGVKPEL